MQIISTLVLVSIRSWNKVAHFVGIQGLRGYLLKLKTAVQVYEYDQTQMPLYEQGTIFFYQ